MRSKWSPGNHTVFLFYNKYNKYACVRVLWAIKTALGSQMMKMNESLIHSLTNSFTLSSLPSLSFSVSIHPSITQRAVFAKQRNTKQNRVVYRIHTHAQNEMNIINWNWNEPNNHTVSHNISHLNGF